MDSGNNAEFMSLFGIALGASILYWVSNHSNQSETDKKYERIFAWCLIVFSIFVLLN